MSLVTLLLSAVITQPRGSWTVSCTHTNPCCSSGLCRVKAWTACREERVSRAGFTQCCRTTPRPSCTQEPACSSCSKLAGLLSTALSLPRAVLALPDQTLTKLHVVCCLRLLVCTKSSALWLGGSRGLAKPRLVFTTSVTHAQQFTSFLTVLHADQTRFALLSHGDWQSCFEWKEAYGLATALQHNRSMQGWGLNVASRWRWRSDTWGLYRKQ